MKVKNLKIKPKLVSLMFAGTIATTTLVGCSNMDIMDTDFGYNKAVIFRENCALIVDIYEYSRCQDMQYKIILEDGTYFTTSNQDTKLINEKDGITAEDLVKAIMGEDIQINYLKVKKKVREK